MEPPVSIKTKSELEDRINTLVRECDKETARADKAGQICSL